MDRQPVDDSDITPDGPSSWRVLLAGAIGMAFTFGTPYSYGVFLGPFSEVFGLSTVVLSTVFAVQLFAFFVGAGLIGVFATRIQIRYVLAASAVVVALAAPSLYVVDSYVGLVLVFGLFGTALGTVYVILASIVPQWFRERRGIATGILIAGVGVSLFVFPPAWRFAFDTFGVRQGVLVLAAAHAGAFLLAAVVCTRPPWAEPSTVSTGELLSRTLQLIRTRTFLVAALGVGLSFAWYNLLAAYAVELFTSRGFSAYGASAAFGLVGGISIGSRIASGAIADRVGYRRTYLGFLACATFGTVLLFSSTTPAVLLAVVAYGLALGGVGTLYIPVLLAIFGAENDTAVIGVFNVVLGIFAIAAPPVATALLESSQSYVPVVSVTLLTTIGAFAAIYRVES
jgi:MFS family permease